jgi:hypothetical protein
LPTFLRPCGRLHGGFTQLNANNPTSGGPALLASQYLRI